ncbi:hypothetical protein RT95_12310 [Xanthomonas campestris]|nr:hypothetical protein RT95_12310 [Xanthomonas campestris]
MQVRGSGRPAAQITDAVVQLHATQRAAPRSAADSALTPAANVRAGSDAVGGEPVTAQDRAALLA